MIDVDSFFKQQRLVDIELIDLDDELSGYIVEYSRDFVLVQIYEDFQLDGYSVLPRKSIKKLASSDTLLFCEKVLSDNSVQVSMPDSISIESNASLFRSFIKDNEVILIDSNKDDDYFFVGRVLEVKKNQVIMSYIDSTSNQDYEPLTIDYDDLDKVTFRSHYANVYNKYTQV
jgi:hypothetical protein